MAPPAVAVGPYTSEHTTLWIQATLVGVPARIPVTHAGATSNSSIVIPPNEAWFWQNPETVKTYYKAVADVRAGRVVRRESYAAYADDLDDD